MTEKVTQKKIRSFRLSEQLEEMIRGECARTGINFSGFIRRIAEKAIYNRESHAA